MSGALRFWEYILKALYLDMEYKGAQPPEAIAVPSVEQFKEYQESGRGNDQIHHSRTGA